MKTLAVVGLAAVFRVASQSVTSCGSDSDHLKDVKITVSPDPIKAGSPFTITASGNLDEAIVGGSATADLDIKALGIIDKHVSSESPFTISPGIAVGAQSLTIGPVSLPKLPGSVVLQGTVHLTNSKAEPLACIKFDLNVPAMAEEEKGTILQDSPVADCSQPSDHLKNLKVAEADNVTTITGTLDEAIMKFTTNVDLTLKVGFFSHKIDIALPISYTPGFPAGDLKITAGPPSPKEALQMPNVEAKPKISGTVKINDGNNEEIVCLSIQSQNEAEAMLINPSEDTCEVPGDCGHAYQACCIGFEAKGFPCACHLSNGTGTAGSSDCGTCGKAFVLCCDAFNLKGSPCGCDIKDKDKPAFMVV